MHATQPSDTAILIARSLLLSSLEPELKRLVAEEETAAIKRLLALCDRHDRFARAMEIPALRQILRFAEACLLPGIIAHYLVRKRQIEDHVEEAIANGCQQVVILGAGFDTLAWRLHRKHPHTHFIELDHPATQQVKRDALGEAINFTLRPIDFLTVLPSSVLADVETWDGTSTAFVAEGLTMYLPSKRVEELVSDLAKSTGPNGSVVFTFMERRPDGSIQFQNQNPLVTYWLGERSEPFLWGISRIELPTFLRSHGLKMTGLHADSDFRNNQLSPRQLHHLPLAKGELLCVATPLPRRDIELHCNDKHSKLNPVTVAEVLRPKSEMEVIQAVRRAAKDSRTISICGARHAMGGQQFGSGTLLIDLSQLTTLHTIDTRRGLVEAGAGIMWPALIEGLHAQQAGSTFVWSIRQKQTGADDLTLGGSLAANIHGRGLKMRPIIDDVEAFTLIDGDGRRHRCSRRENAELFRLAIGGYGCFGVITSVLLRLAPRQKLERLVEITTIDKLSFKLNERIADGSVFGDFQFSIDEKSPDFLNCGVLSTYHPVDASTPMPIKQLELDHSDWEELIHLAHHDRSRVFKVYSDFYLSTHHSLHWSDTHQLSVYLEDYHSKLDHDCHAEVPASEMISEFYVPREDLAAFMLAAADLLKSDNPPVIYGTIRLIQRDNESFLAWARGDFACIIFNLHTEHSDEGVERTSAAIRALIDLALSFGGSYYLTYHRWARHDQVGQAHPHFREFLEKKEQFDPGRRFQSEWWRHHRSLLAPA
ncbi:SAM-dependent methyltransferase [Haloferula chungangensis]|uniref:SAM-dependent methyltransferase n=1 Tax=Haloferula chungangensis TaxID=1048331 RepID=A0ABW2LCC6_9BACT